MSDPTVHLDRIKDDPSPQTRFAFGGAVSEVLRDYLDRDCQQARLSSTFKLYYRLRPLIPVPARHFLQRRRNQGFKLSDNWYLPTAFFNDFRNAVETERKSVVIHPWPDGYEMSAVLTHDVETQEGMDSIDKLAALEEEYGFRSAWNVVPYKYKVDSGLLADLKQRGHEIGVHGYNHDGRLFESRQTFTRRTDGINQAIKSFGSSGFRSPMAHRNLEWLQDLDIDYEASCFDFDPFQAMAGGVGGVWPFIAGKFVELPYTLPQDHTLIVSLGESTPRVWIDKLAYLRQLAGMAMVITHPDYLNSPQRLDIYREFLEYLTGLSNCWCALPNEIAAWWRLRDAMTIDHTGTEHQLTGDASGRARTFLIGSLLDCETV
ncbi:Polysaccharide deacetylase [Neorhodopirellula lusitana]|uniref:Polysaccharide deacetylase n=1 Tax=Neorhodopirellula lusitana TaxID=445327 RepID=A0ABY1QH67_9BACT|nr:polysaccharide deacetylase family protein [Neorhodopirellula lusitana]SMP68471.1 Polysaccharide deacetylase [Neorhodopirellula lusitana]